MEVKPVDLIFEVASANPFQLGLWFHYLNGGLACDVPSRWWFNARADCLLLMKFAGKIGLRRNLDMALRNVLIGVDPERSTATSFAAEGGHEHC